MDKTFDKKYENKEWLEAELATKSSRTISKELGVSYKLINAWAVRFGIIRKTEDVILP